jgi:hypothetical protein
MLCVNEGLLMSLLRNHENTVLWQVARTNQRRLGPRSAHSASGKEVKWFDRALLLLKLTRATLS